VGSGAGGHRDSIRAAGALARAGHETAARGLFARLVQLDPKSAFENFFDRARNAQKTGR